MTAFAEGDQQATPKVANTFDRSTTTAINAY